MVSTVAQIGSDALRLCGQSGAPGRPITNTDQQAEIARFLNLLLDGWNTKRSSIFTIRIDQYPLVPSQQVYTIGPGGNFNAPRPIRITAANLILTTSTPAAHLQMRLLTDEEWSKKIITQIPTTVPRELYNDGASPLSNLYFWGTPTLGYNVELFTWQALSTGLLYSDSISYPDGYAVAITYNLAKMIGPLYHVKQNPMWADVLRIAQQTRADIASLNRDSSKTSSDGAFIGGTGQGWDYYDYLTGGF